MTVEDKIIEGLKGKVTEKIFSGDRKVDIVPHAASLEISREMGLDRNLVERVAFSIGAVPERYARNLITFDHTSQQKLFDSKVALVGLGGLGGHLLESLARAGVGNIIACDGDSFEPSNLNRQRLATENSLSQKKSEAAFEMVRKVNPAVFLDVRSDYLEGDDFDEFIAGSDIVVDCLGGLEHRTSLKEAAARANLPLVTASVAGWAGVVATVHPGAMSPSDFFGDNNGLEETLGTPIPAISVAVGVQSAEVLKILCGQEAGLAGKALLFDLQKLYFDVVTL